MPIAISLNLNAEQQAPLAPQRKKNLNHEKDDMMDMMNKATKVQLKTDLGVESDEVPQPIATQEPAQEASVGTTVAEENDSAAEEEHPVAEDDAEAEAETEGEGVEEPTAASEVEATTTVEHSLKQITEEVGKLAAETAQPVAEVGRQSFMSLTDLIRNLRPNDKANPQIDSDYSNTMRVLGEPGAVIVESSRKVRNSQQVY